MAVGDTDNLALRMQHISELTAMLFALQTESEQARTLAEHVGEEIAVARLQIRLSTPAMGTRRIARFIALRTR